MTITREQVADLQPGDVVEITEIVDGDVYTHRGPVRAEPGHRDFLTFAGYTIHNAQGRPGLWIDTLTVVSRAPRPLYVNHPRTEPVPGDVVRDADSGDPRTWHYLTWPGGPWYDLRGNGKKRVDLPTRLRLLVDGETGRCVP